MSSESKEIVFNFCGKRFVVTGASSGIGRQIAAELAGAGAVVLALARRSEQLKQLELEYPGNIIAGIVDVTDTAALEKAIGDFGKDGKISGSVHAAGCNKVASLKAIKKQSAQEILDVNLLAGIELVKISSQKKLSAPNASHVHICSISSLKGEAGLTVYCASKSAAAGAVRAMALELSRQNIRYNCVSPGWIPETEMTAKLGDLVSVEKMASKHPLGVGTPRDVAGMVLFLLSDRANWITGSNIVVDGGYLA